MRKNSNNYGYVRGLLKKEPEFKAYSTGAGLVKFFIQTCDDEGDAGHLGPRRNAQDVEIGIWRADSASLDRYRNLKPSDCVECKYWIESFVYEKDGEQLRGQSLRADDIVIYGEDIDLDISAPDALPVGNNAAAGVAATGERGHDSEIGLEGKRYVEYEDEPAPGVDWDMLSDDELEDEARFNPAVRDYLDNWR